MRVLSQFPPCRHPECHNRRECIYNGDDFSEYKKKPCHCIECEKRHNRAVRKKTECPIENCLWCSDAHEFAKDDLDEICVCPKCASRHKRAVDHGTKCRVPNCVWCAAAREAKRQEELEDRESFWSFASSCARAKCTGHESGHCKKTCTYYPCCGRYCGSARCKKHAHCAKGIRVCANSVPHQ